MKKIINRITFVLAAVALLVSCEADYIMFDSSKNFVAFPSEATTLLKPGAQVAMPVYVIALEGSPAITVDFDFDVTDLPNPAIEGVDFNLLNASKTLSFPEGWGYDTIWIQPIDNDVFEGNKAFNIDLLSNSQSFQFGAISTNMATIIDDEHPLKAWIGSYTVDAQSYGSPDTWDEIWDVAIAAVAGDISSLGITINSTPYGGPGDEFLATFDTEAMTITIAPGTEVGNIYGYTSTVINVGDYSYLDTESPVVGTIEEDGTIKIDNLSMVTPGGSVWDAFNTTWAKTGKKTISVGEGHDSKVARFK